MKYIGVFLVLAFCARAPAFAQNAANLPLVGVLRINTPDTVEPAATQFRAALAALGRVDGHTIRLEYRLAEGHVERLPELAQALVAENAKVIVALGDPAVRAAQQATRSIPIVAIADDLVASGLISSLARPGGNTTGVSIFATELDAKKLEILKRIVPAARRFGVISDAANTVPARRQAIADRARTVGVEVQIVDVRGPADIAPAFASFRAEGAEAIDILASPLLTALRKELGRLSVDYRLPAICQFREAVEAGCLASYGVRLSDALAMVAALTDKMLKGAQPGDTPAEQPTRFELVISQSVARAIGIEIPATILDGADEVIE
jgi:putative tryptophan/tyrosine transport system substrate-binding protein